MAKKKRKNKLIPLISLLCVFAVLLSGYYILKAYNAKLEAENTEEADKATIEVIKKESAIPVALSYTLDGNTLEFSFENEKWVYTPDRNFPLASNVVASMASGLTDIKAVSKLEVESPNASDFGLDKPLRTVYCKYSDNTEFTMDFGSVNSFNGHQYFNIRGTEDIYMVETTVSGAFTKPLSSLFNAEVWPLLNDTVATEDITSVVIETAGGQSTTVEYPETVEILFNLIYNLDLGTWEDYYADETEMADTYGLRADGDRVTINYNKETTIKNEDGSSATATVPASYTVYFGNEFEIEKEAETTAEGETETTEHRFFYTQDGSTVVYSGEKETADKIFEYLGYVPPVEEETAAE